MKKNILGLAIASAFAAPAAAIAQGTFVQIYGTINSDFQYASADNPTAVPAGINGAVLNGTTRPLGPTPVNNNIPGQFGVSSNSSDIGVRGSENLGGGFLAVFQLESFVLLELGGGNLGGRNSNVGLETPWGLVFYGVWDTPYKNMFGKPDPFHLASAASFVGIFGSPGFNIFAPTTSAAPTLTANANASDASAFARRQQNTIAYWTPNFAGFSARVHFSPGELKGTATPLGYATAQGFNPWLWSIAGIYDSGPIYAALGYEQHKDYFGTRLFTGATDATGTSSTDWGARAALGVQKVLGGLNVFALYERLSYSTDGVIARGQVTDWRRDSFGLMGTYPFGNITLRGGWMKVKDPSCSTFGAVCLSDNLGTNQYTVGASYNFSKRTLVYAYWVLQANDSFARFKYGANTGPVSSGGNATVGIGTQPTAVGLGMRHTF